MWYNFWLDEKVVYAKCIFLMSTKKPIVTEFIPFMYKLYATSTVVMLYNVLYTIEHILLRIIN